jgi:hydrogenase nickel incorporation protein HypA/HybF
LHEISLLENVREILQDHARNQNFSHIKKITLEIGKLSCVEPDALRFGFDVVMKDTLAEKAELIMTEIDGIGLCDKCGKQVTMETLYDPCSACGNPFVTVTQGYEMKIKDLIVI